MVEFSSEYPLGRSDVIKLLQHYSITPTRQRVEIASFLFQKQQHLSAEHILDAVNSNGHRVSRATVYNTMGLFSRKGLVREVLIDRERVFYDSNNSQHHHIYDVDSGELRDIEGSGVEVAGLPELPEDVRIVDASVVIRTSRR